MQSIQPVKIFSAKQIKQWDHYTITHEPVRSIDLMERAAMACCNWLKQQQLSDAPFKIFCGKGNNGGDGLAIARLLHESGWKISVYILDSANKGSEDFEINFIRLKSIFPDIHFITTSSDFPDWGKDDIIIDALFGTGLNKPVEGIASSLIAYINGNSNQVISIDLPSGLFVDSSSIKNEIIKATDTLTFQCTKLCFLVAENGPYIGKVTILPIGLSEEFYEQQKNAFELVDLALIKNIYRPREAFSHKGTFGFACIIAGSKGMMGAAVLATRACLKSGAGKVVCITPEAGYTIIQNSAPEAMVIISGNKIIKEIPSLESNDSIGIGPGIGEHRSHRKLLSALFAENQKPMVIDADALNVISGSDKLLRLIPPNSIITPHLKEFHRMFGESGNEFERMKMALQKSKEHGIYIVLKGHYTLITTPDMKGYFNSTGNPGMATGGSGDVLTGIITGLLAQGYPALEASLLGVYLHGLSGDIAADIMSQEAMLAGDIIWYLGEAFKRLN